jgi:predicted RNA-binding protein with PUA-like domain
MRLTARRGHLFPKPRLTTQSAVFSWSTAGAAAPPISRGFTLSTAQPSQPAGDAPQYWLMKSEPDEASIDHLQAAGELPWTGVRNYQARNFMRDQMRIGDGVLFYHSSCPEPGIAGFAEVSSTAYPDATQFDPASPYFDPKSKPEAPRWSHVDVRFVRKTRLLSLAEMKRDPVLSQMRTLQPGNRLSITPVTAAEWRHLQALLA